MNKIMTPRMMLIASMAIFGTLGPFVRNISVSSGELALYRAIMATGLVGVFLLITKQKIPFDKIKKEAVEAAEAEAVAIREAAMADAGKIVADAQAQAEKILTDARAETERMTKSGEDAIRQAGRNLLLSFRESVARELHAIVGENVDAVYSSEEKMAVLLSGENLAELESTLRAALKQRLSEGVTLKPGDTLDRGFRIAVQNGSVYYDYSAEAVVDMLSGYLSPRVTALMKEAE